MTTEGSARQHGRGIAQAVLVGDLGGLTAPEVRAEAAASGQGTGAANAGGVAPQGNGTSTPAAGAATTGNTGGGQGGEGGATGEATGAGHDAGHAAQSGAVGAGAAAASTAAQGHAEGGHDIPGEPETTFLPGLRSPVAADAQGELGAPSGRRTRACTHPNHSSGMAKRRWAMTIDLARCTGCSACVTACYSENNIPTVGAPWQAARSRPRVATSARLQHHAGPRDELDAPRALLRGRATRRTSSAEDFDARFVPMLCQHCGNAPCEPVCPVYATYHSPDGLNVQVYNRCVGTRYCTQQLPVQGPLLQLVRLRRGGSQAVRVPGAAATGSSTPTSPSAARA